MFSVVIPLYNKAHTIKRTLKSDLNQTFIDFEILVINDGSTDTGVDIVNNFKDKRVKVLNQENQGVSAARNKGVANAQFEFIALLDGDDEWDEKYLETISQSLQKYPKTGMVCCAGFFKNLDTDTVSLRIAKK